MADVPDQPPADVPAQYDLAEALTPPDLPGRATAATTTEGLYERMASDLLTHSLNCVRAFGDFHLALACSPALEGFYRHLMIDPLCRGIPWKRTHLWLAHEEKVADPEADGPCWLTVRELIGLHAGIPLSQQHAVDLSVREPGRAYQGALRAALEWRERGQDRLDYVALSLEPGGGISGGIGAYGTEGGGGQLVCDRPQSGGACVLSLEAVSASRLIAIVAVGEAVAETVEALARRDGVMGGCAALRVLPVGRGQQGEAHWYVDGAAMGIGKA